MLERLSGKDKVSVPEVGEVAPDFTLPTPAGDSFTLSEELKKGPVALAFFKISCGTCQFTFPFLERLTARYPREPATFRGVSQDDVVNTGEFCKRLGITFPMTIDHPDYAASRLYSFETVPTILLVAPNGRIRFRQSGFSKAGLQQLSEELGKLLNRAPEPVFLPNEQVPETKPG